MTKSTVADILAGNAIAVPNRVAYQDAHQERSITYAQLDRRSNQLANAFLAAGLAAGDRIALWMTTGISTVEVYFAAAKAGLVVTPVNDKLVPNEAIFQVESSGARGLVYSGELEHNAAEVLETCELALVACDSAPGLPGARLLESMVERGSESRPRGPQPHDLYLLAYTSGTTGRPKGAMLTHQTILTAGRMNALSYRLPIGSVGLYRTSMSFPATIGSFLMSHLHTRGTVVLASSGDPEWIVDQVIRHRANYSSIAPPLLGGFIAEIKKRPEALSSLTSVLCGASAAPPSLLREAVDVIGDRLLEGWGMTEHSGALVTATTRLDFTGHDEARSDVFSSVGRAVPGALIRLAGDDREPLQHDGVAVGELVISSPALAVGYWNNPEATAEAFVDGWYHTGDLATIDEQGYVYVSDRRSDLIVTGGINVYPREVESVLENMPGIRDVAVVGAPHPKWGQSVVAVVVPKANQQISESAVIDFARGRMAGFKKPTRVIFVEGLPKTVSEKVKRQEIRNLALEAIAANPAPA
jgi:acyl-CoA synthetase (AMP-forming)/AMP-acid ligase II